MYHQFLFQIRLVLCPHPPRLNMLVYTLYVHAITPIVQAPLTCFMNFACMLREQALTIAAFSKIQVLCIRTSTPTSIHIHIRTLLESSVSFHQAPLTTWRFLHPSFAFPLQNHMSSISLRINSSNSCLCFFIISRASRRSSVPAAVSLMDLFSSNISREI